MRRRSLREALPVSEKREAISHPTIISHRLFNAGRLPEFTRLALFAQRCLFNRPYSKRVPQDACDVHDATEPQCFQ